MKKIEEYKGVIILILIVLAGAFYWYEWRPGQIIKKCSAISLVGWTQNGEINYKNCLRDNGLEK